MVGKGVTGAGSGHLYAIRVDFTSKGLSSEGVSDSSVTFSVVISCVSPSRKVGTKLSIYCPVRWSCPSSSESESEDEPEATKNSEISAPVSFKSGAECEFNRVGRFGDDT